MVLTLGALLALAGISAATTMISSAANQAHAVAAREDTQAFNAQEAQIQRNWSSQEAQTARDFNAAEAQKQRDFEKYMSDTAYQRQRADLEAAGYNPASIGLGAGASTPVGTSASVGNPTGTSASASMPYVPQENVNYFSNLFSNAIQYQMAKDRNFTNKAIAEMYTQNASQMNKLTNATKKIIANKNTRYWYTDDGKLAGAINGTSAFNPTKPYYDYKISK